MLFLLPVFGMMGLGYMYARIGWISESSPAIIGRFVWLGPFPCALLDSLLSLDFTVVRPSVCLLFLSVSGVMYAVFYMGFRWLLRCKPNDAAMFVLTSCMGHVLFIGPEVLRQFDSPQTKSLVAMMVLSDFVIYVVSLMIVSSSLKLKTAGFGMLQWLMTNPLVIACGLTVVFFVLGWTDHHWLRQIVHFPGRVAAPASLFVMGAGFMQLKKTPWKLPILMTINKLLVLPIVGCSVIILGGLSVDLGFYWLLLLSLPTAGLVFITAQQYHSGETEVLMATVLTVLGAGVTMPWVFSLSQWLLMTV